MPEKLRPVREPSCNELLYMDLQDFTNSYAIQLLLKVSRIENLPRIEEAVNTVLKDHPGINVYCRNKKYYPVTEPVRIKELTVETDDLYNHPFFQEKIDYRSHSVEISLLHHSSGEYLVIKLMHSVLDGKAALVFIQNIANVLNGKEQVPTIAEMDDHTFVKTKEHYSKPESKLPKIRLNGAVPVKNSIERWRVFEVPGYPNAVIARISRVLADLSPDGCGRIMIPADIRRYEPGVEYDTNLTLPLFLTVSKEETVGEIYGDLLVRMRDKKELNLANTTYFHYKSLPGFLRKSILRILISQVRRRNKFAVNGLISLLGRVNLKDYDNPCFAVEEFYSLPDQQALLGLSMVITQYNKKTNVTFAYFDGQYSEEVISELAEKMRASLSPDPYAFNQKTKVKHEDSLSLILHNLQTLKDAVAFIDTKEYTYEELFRGACRIVGMLRTEGICEDVCLRMKRGFGYLVSVLACIYEGICYIPIDLVKSEAEAETIRKSTVSGRILTDADIEKVLADPSAQEVALSCQNEPEREVYRIYTSGTTNEPKCVPIRRKNLDNFLGWCANEFGQGTPANMPLFTSISVDLTVSSTFIPLLFGGYIRAFSENFNASVWHKILSDPQLNVIKGTPTHFLFMDAAGLKESAQNNGPKTFIIGGENLSSDLAKSILAVFGKGTVIYNEYGPTECTVGVTKYRMDEGTVCKEDNVPIGTPIDNTAILLMKDGKVITSENETGEILISGDSVFDGYRNIDADCFAEVKGIRYYRSGDLGFVRGGVLHCIGREDGQVKINGNRVELDSIRHAVNALEGVKDAVILYEGGLYAFLVGDSEKAAEMKESLLATLPSYMVPKELIFVDAIPIGAGGKADIKALKMQLSERVSGKVKEAKASGGEDRLTQILATYLDGIQVSGDENLYAAGMESIDILRFTQEVKEEYIAPECEDAFYSEVLANANRLTLQDVEKLIVRYGKKV